MLYFRLRLNAVFYILLLVLFWFSLATLFYTYIGYAVALSFIKPKAEAFAGDLPGVSVIIPAYNEAGFLQAKLNNCLEFDYPATLVELIFITDGSNDGSETSIAQTDQIRLLHQPERQGKAAALNRAVPFASHDILVFTDANAIVNPGALKAMMRHFQNPEVGGVAGEKKILQEEASTGVDEGEGIYWRYESLMKQLDSRFYSVMGAAGELFAIRSSLYQAIPEDTIVDDLMISINVCLQGKRVVYEPQAVAREAASMNLTEETKRKIRIAAGGFQARKRLWPLIRRSNARLIFQFISRRVLRWSFSPWLLPLLLLSNLALSWFWDEGFFQAVLILQLIFYTLAALGYLFILDGKRYALFNAPFYFVYMHWCTLLGWLRFKKGSQSAIWEKAKRRTN